ncbi:CehA/McbA family metallohydrolase [Thermoactinospora rubra]|uniref:CehA/McbA family metallohydrolase n=1 Tax=Thermoactinospora rubra TaxID=1088767 RepID=UPI000A0F6F12|nr:CehA/McbA family metallohydrolase [Thermoactinospora rubra]
MDEGDVDRLLPEPVAKAVAEYRALRDEHGVCWGEQGVAYLAEVRTSAYLMPPYGFSVAAYRRAVGDRDGDPLVADRIVRDTLAGDVLDNLAALRLTPEGASLEARTQAVLDDTPPRTTLLLDSSRDEPATVTVNGTPYQVEPKGARLVEIDGAAEVIADGRRVDLTPLARRVPKATLTLRAGFPCRWSVSSEDGQGWWPGGVPRKLDAHRRPYFHGDGLTLDVPAETVVVQVTRGMEYATDEVRLDLAPGEHRLVELRPERLYDAESHGWYGGDLHVHLNWMGEEPAGPALAAAAQEGEDLHVLNLVAGNVAGERVYDREAMEHWAGRDLPWSDERHIARFGVEYRNDLLGHCTAFGLGGPPSRWHSGFTGADHPPNSRILRELGGVRSYGHPFHTPGDELGSGRNCAAREVVADAALGLVDALDVLNHSSIEATAAVYRRLIGAGNRLAVSAGTDAVLSICRRGTASSPPGWARVYAWVDGPLTAESYGEAIQLGRTFATTGPWLELKVNGHGPGETLRLAAGERVRVQVRSVGPEVERLEVRTAGGVAAQGPPGRLEVELRPDEPTYVVAVATGGPHPRSMHPEGVYAHTSPVYLEVGGGPIARPEDVRWCLDWLDRLEGLVRELGRFDADGQLEAHLELYEQARAVYRARLDGHGPGLPDR